MQITQADMVVLSAKSSPEIQDGGLDPNFSSGGSVSCFTFLRESGSVWSLRTAC